MGCSYCKFLFSNVPHSNSKLIYSQAAANATKHEPPNLVEFDVSQDGSLTTLKHRGRVGPCAEVQATTADSANVILMAALLPIITNLSQKCSTLR